MVHERHDNHVSHRVTVTCERHPHPASQDLNDTQNIAHIRHDSCERSHPLLTENFPRLSDKVFNDQLDKDRNRKICRKMWLILKCSLDRVDLTSLTLSIKVQNFIMSLYLR